MHWSASVRWVCVSCGLGVSGGRADAAALRWAAPAVVVEPGPPSLLASPAAY